MSVQMMQPVFLLSLLVAIMVELVAMAVVPFFGVIEKVMETTHIIVVLPMHPLQ